MNDQPKLGPATAAIRRAHERNVEAMVTAALAARR